MTGFITAPAFAFAGVGFLTFAMPIGARIQANLTLTHYLKPQINQLQNAPFWWAIPSLLGFTTAVVILLLLSSALTLRVFKQPERWGRLMTRDTLEHTDHDLNDHLDRRSFSAGLWQTLRAVMRDKGAILLLVIAPLLYGFSNFTIQHRRCATSAGRYCRS